MKEITSAFKATYAHHQMGKLFCPRSLKEYQLRLTFDNGVVKDLDLQTESYGEVFEPLKEINLFKQVEVNPETNTIEWPNGADFAPEFLYEIGLEVERETTPAGIEAA